jgi:hypothetical protein
LLVRCTRAPCRGPAELVESASKTNAQTKRIDAVNDEDFRMIVPMIVF